MTPASRQTDRCDPCPELQADITRLLRGGAEDSVVRRVLVHVEICPRCRGFLQSLRAEAGLLGEDGPGRLPSFEETEDPFALDLFDDEKLRDEVLEGSASESQGEFLRGLLEQSREKLAEVLFQLGRAYVLLAMSPEIVSIFVREPVPIPEYRLRGRAIIDGVHGARENSGLEVRERSRWVEAEDLLQGRLDSVSGNLNKGKSLLRLCLRLRSPYPAAQIFLAKCLMQQGDHDLARRAYREVLTQTARGKGPLDPLTRVPLRTYAMEHMGVLSLVEGKPELARCFFQWVVASGAPEEHPSFSSSLLNLAYSHLLLGQHGKVAGCLAEIYERFPGKRREIGQLLMLKVKFQSMIRENAEVRRRLQRTCPDWFGPSNKPLRHGEEVPLQIVFDEEEPLEIHAVSSAGHAEPASPIGPAHPSREASEASPPDFDR